MAEFLTHHRKKLFIVFLISALLMVGLFAQLGFLMIARSDHYSKMADELHKRERIIKAARGDCGSEWHCDRREPDGLHRVRDPQSGDGAGEGDPGAGADPGASRDGGPEKGRKVVFQGDHPDKCGEVGGGRDHESRTLRREGRRGL